MHKPEVAAAIESAQEKRAQRPRVPADRVVTELAQVAFRDPRPPFSWGPGGIEVRAAPAVAAQKNHPPTGDAQHRPPAATPHPWPGDLSLTAETARDDVVAPHGARGGAAEESPVAKTGAPGPTTAVYFRRPDGNLIEVANYD